MPRKNYVLTLMAERHLEELTAFSLDHWGEGLTDKYLADLHEAAQRIARDHRSYAPRRDLSGGTGLSVYPVREHYIVYESLGKGRIAIAAIIRQGRDMPAILDSWGYQIREALKQIREELERENASQARRHSR